MGRSPCCDKLIIKGEFGLLRKMQRYLRMCQNMELETGHLFPIEQDLADAGRVADLGGLIISGQILKKKPSHPKKWS
ncbi:hypothetical protein Pint_27026 [Pistacia integerrima]|uniref:Uncharacterized protein n=1 Tax=Pistacia integerrima TaxID=434235 RepID=A0ACC0YPA7_9ROSI|nr:hypothetical protein Pint_27026 [Pistacia integerrima]